MLIELLFYNYSLWHLEDKARLKTAGDTVIAKVKRAIDKENQLRNDTIENIDEYISGILFKKKIKPRKNAYRNTETVGAAIDRLCIISLKIYHMREETLRSDADASHILKCGERLKLLKLQRSDLGAALDLLAAKIYAGEIVQQIYRQMKMYNDPTLNPEVYKQK
mgnify:CR=1 FL=1